jgi:zinc transporter ZupT
MKWLVFIIVSVGLLTIACLRTGLVGDCVGIASCIWYALLPFLGPKRVRARWATRMIFFNGLLGVAFSSVYLMLHSGWLAISYHTNHTIHSWLSFVGVIFLGLSFILIVTRQLPGAKLDEITHDPPA